MNERLAFFCDRDTAPCHLYTWAHMEGENEALYQVYSRLPLDDPGLDAKGRVDSVAAIKPRVATAGGGLIAATRQVGTTTELRVETVPAAGYDPATDLLVLRPGEGPAWEGISSAAIGLGPGAFILLPGTRTDQSNLQGFLDHLNRLPGDYRTLLLNVLRRPGIEGALWRLERRLDRLAGAPVPAAAPEDRHQAQTQQFPGAWPWLLTSLLVLNLIAVVASTWWLKGAQEQSVPPFTYRLDGILSPGSGPPLTHWLDKDPFTLLTPQRLGETPARQPGGPNPDPGPTSTVQ